MNWIFVKNSMPKDNTSIVFACENGYVYTGYYNNGFYSIEDENFEKEDVYVWAYLPDFPDLP